MVTTTTPTMSYSSHADSGTTVTVCAQDIYDLYYCNAPGLSDYDIDPFGGIYGWPSDPFLIERKAPKHKPAKPFPRQRKAYYGRR